MKTLAQALNIGFTIVGCIVLGTFIGYLLDNWLCSKPIFMIIGIILGTITAFYSLYSLVVKNDN